jgi:hypothetical protein
MRFGNLPLARDPQQREEDDHWAAPGGKPEGTGHAVAIPDETGAKEGGAPEPGLYIHVLDSCNRGVNRDYVGVNIQIQRPMLSDRSGLCDWRS